jgi:hypothetical protein
LSRIFDVLASEKDFLESPFFFLAVEVGAI